MSRENLATIIVAILAMSSLSATAIADDVDLGNSKSGQNKVDLSLRTNVLLGDGQSSKEILGYGVIGRYYLSSGWFTGATLDNYEYDYGHATHLGGIAQGPADSEIDALATNTVISGFIGRLYGGNNQGFDWFWTAGLGVGFPNINNFSGYTIGGEPFALTYEADTEIHLTSSIGTSYRFTPTWSATFAARLEHHFMEVTATDSVSGSTSTIDAQSPLGAYLSIDYRF
jgi:hypothetical protein